MPDSLYQALHHIAVGIVVVFLVGSGIATDPSVLLVAGAEPPLLLPNVVVNGTTTQDVITMYQTVAAPADGAALVITAHYAGPLDDLNRPDVVLYVVEEVVSVCGAFVRGRQL